MNLKKKASKSIAIALVGVSMITPILNTASAMEMSNQPSIMNISEVKDINDIPIGSVVEITDEQAEKVFREYFPEKELPQEESSKYSRARGGVTKIVMRSTGCDIYLSKKVAEMVIDAGSSAVGFLVGLIPGISTGLAITVINSILSNVSKPFVSRGIIIKVRYPMTIVSIRKQ